MKIVILDGSAANPGDITWGYYIYVPARNR